MPPIPLCIFAMITFVAALAPIRAQGQIIETDAGKLEIIGLEKETPQQLWNRIYARTPVEGAHACAAVLKDEFGYPDASVIAYPDSAGEVYWVVTVVEPHNRQRVKRRYAPEHAEENISEWSPMFSIFSNDFGIVQDAMLEYHLVAQGKRDSALAALTKRVEYMRSLSSRDEPDFSRIDSIWTFLMNHRSAADKELALRTLASDGNDENRMMAAAVIANFPDDPRAWHAALGTLLEKNDEIELIGKFTLWIFRNSGERRVDWAPAVEPLRALLNGTNLFAFNQVAALLTITDISPSLAAPLLKENYHLLLAKFKAHHPDERRPTHELLVKLRGKDLGETPDAWESWLAGL